MRTHPAQSLSCLFVTTTLLVWIFRRWFPRRGKPSNQEADDPAEQDSSDYVSDCASRILPILNLSNPKKKSDSCSDPAAATDPVGLPGFMSHLVFGVLSLIHGD